MKYIGIVATVIIIAVITFATVKKVSPVGWGLWGTTNTASGVALRGYDPVAYFDDAAAVSGDAAFTLEWRDAVWQFRSAGNKARFEANPELYAPQFGGFCAFAISKGFTADPMPDAWHIEGGNLYVFADQDVRDQWVATLGEGSLQRSRDNWATRQ